MMAQPPDPIKLFPDIGKKLAIKTESRRDPGSKIELQKYTNRSGKL